MPKCRTCNVDALTKQCALCSGYIEVTCPQCQVRIPIWESFSCGGCGRSPICTAHLVRGEDICNECGFLAGSEAPPGFTPLGENEKKHREFLWTQDQSRMVRVPAGDFLYGESKQKRYLPDFYIDVFPVTVEQYMLFLKATKRKPPEEMRDPAFNRPKQPIVGVSWEDATSYAAWAGKRLARDAEWEKAARGWDGRIYPWGKAPPTPELANFAHNMERTTSVSHYTNGRSPYGCFDMAGNVLEWCWDWLDEGRGTRVLRGGSWVSEANVLRASFRYGDSPTYRYPIIGFRCAWGILAEDKGGFEIDFGA